MSSIINIQTRIEPQIRRKVKEYLSKITDLSEPFRYMGRTFVFSANTNLDTAVNKIFISLGDSILNDIEGYVKSAISLAEAEEDDNTIIPYISREQDGITPQKRIDRHSSRLKYIVEGWIAIGFANKITKGKIINEMTTFLDNRTASTLWKKAEKDANYSATILKDGELLKGKGIMSSVIKSYSLIGETMTREAYTYGRILQYEKMGAIGYKVKRNSSYDCPLCDELCEVIHPLNEIVLPAHPRCCCTTIPIFLKDI